MKYFVALLILGTALGSPMSQEFSPCSTTPSGELLPSPVSPKHYELCRDGDAFTLECPLSLIFNEALSMCDSPSNSINTAVAPAAAECPLTGNSTLPYSGKCSVYKECIQGIHYYRNCPSGKEFHPTQLQCVPLADMPPDAPCSKATVPSTISCVGKPNGTYIADRTTCTKFYICVAGTPSARTCPGQLLYHSLEKLCVNPEELPVINQCGIRVPSEPCKEQPDFAVLPDRLNCSIYYSCFKGNATEVKCELDWVFTSPELRCRPFEAGTDPLACMIDNPTETCRYAIDGTNVDDVTDPDCTGSFVCINKKPVLVPCLGDLVYDNVAQRCVNRSQLGNGARCFVPPPVEP